MWWLCSKFSFAFYKSSIKSISFIIFGFSLIVNENVLIYEWIFDIIFMYGYWNVICDNDFRHWQFSVVCLHVCIYKRDAIFVSVAV